MLYCNTSSARVAFLSIFYASLFISISFEVLIQNNDSHYYIMHAHYFARVTVITQPAGDNYTIHTYTGSCIHNRIF